MDRRMRSIAPRTGEPEVTIAEEQHAYRPITVVVRDCDLGLSLVTRWTMTAEERARVAAGEDIYVELLTFGGPMQPIAVSVGSA